MSSSFHSAASGHLRHAAAAWCGVWRNMAVITQPFLAPPSCVWCVGLCSVQAGMAGSPTRCRLVVCVAGCVRSSTSYIHTCAGLLQTFGGIPLLQQHAGLGVHGWTGAAAATAAGDGVAAGSSISSRPAAALCAQLLLQLVQYGIHFMLWLLPVCALTFYFASV
jgi:hypothetical protein